MKGAIPTNKYRNKRVEYDGHTFHSKLECERYKELRLLESGKAITGLLLQPRYKLMVNGIRICCYVADFAYTDLEKKMAVVEDAKGYKTQTYKLKAKLFKALYPQYHFMEIGKNGRETKMDSV